jgi:hypothetical protein
VTAGPAIEVVAVEWLWKTAPRSGGTREERIRVGIAWIDVICHVCRREFRATKAGSVGQPGFYPMFYSVTIACDCGALVGLTKDDLFRQRTRVPDPRIRDSNRT